MANLTGEYDVVIEVGVNVLNGILGAVHENQNTNFPVMPHSLDLVVDDLPHGPGDPIPEGDRTGVQSRIEIQVSTPIVSLPVDTLSVHPDVLGGVLASQARSLPSGRRSALSRVRGDVFDPGDLGGIFVPPTSFGLPRITAKVRIRAWVRDPTGDRLPEFLHGDLFVTAALVRSEVTGVGTFLTLDRTNGPLIAFQPAAGTEITDEQRQTVANIVRNVIRGDMEPATFKVALPPEVRHFDFELQPEARRPSIMALFTLTDRTPGPGARGSVGPGFVPDGADFAVAVGRDFVLGVIESQLSGLLRESYSYSKLGVSATVRPDPPTFDLEPGRIVLSISGDGDISWFGIDDHFTFTISQAFTLQVVDGGLEPVADGDPVVDLDDVAVGGDYIEGKARHTIKEERDAALASGAAQFRQALNLGKQLEQILLGINPSPAGVNLTSVDIRPEGVLVSGTIGLAATGPAVVAQTTRGGLNDALQSWIPGGTIDRFVWQQAVSIPRGSATRVEDHRFVTEPMGVTSFFSSLCLQMEGTRVIAGGGIVPVSASACFRFSPVVSQMTELLPGVPRPLLPLTEPAAGGGVRVIGHYDPWAPGRVPSKGHASLLVYFGPDGDEATKLLGEALKGAGKREGAVLAVGVVPPGALSKAAPSAVLLAEDSDGSWAKAFGVTGPPAAVLVGPDGNALWRESKAITAKKLAAALEKYAKGGGELAATAIRLSIPPGALPPDVRLRLADGGELSLRRLRGRPVALTFWTSRSEPSLNHLDFLRDLTLSRGSKAPLTVAVGDGESHERAAEVAKEHELPYTVLADPDRLVSRSFGVWCWPATVWIRSDLKVEAVDFGGAARTSTGSAPTGPYPKGPRQDSS